MKTIKNFVCFYLTRINRKSNIQKFCHFAQKNICKCLIAFCIFSLAGCSNSQSPSAANEIRLSLEGISDVTISYDEEPITFYQAEGDELIIKEYMTKNKSSYYANVIQSGDSIHISEGGKPFFKSGFSRRIEVFLPASCMEALKITTTDGDIDLSNVRKGLIRNMKDFILEVGKDFTFIDEEYRVQVGGEDYKIDLLFFHRGLQCLVAFELKIGKFRPEYISKMDFYLEALDRQKKKENENPSVGMILCASKDDEVVESSLWPKGNKKRIRIW